MIAREENLWETDVNTYEKDGIDLIINFANKLRVDWGKDWNRRPSDILITKIMLGVFGCVPAFDTYFKKGFGVSSLNKNSLNGISKYYSENKQIDNYLDYVTDFKTGKPFKGKFKYTRARVIDLVFFDIGGGNK